MDDPLAGATTDVAPPSVAAPTFAPGALIAGRYRLESRLGAGGGGTVWRCTDEKLAMTVALKIIGSEGELERWRREVAMARRIADRNVCRVHDLGEADGVRFVTMELVDGIGLRAKIAAGVPLEEARDLFGQVVSGVAAIHAAGVVHRDLKPDNVVVATDGRAVIVDFGLAREPRAPHDHEETSAIPTAVPTSTTLTREGAIVGTPRYMSPEQAAGKIVDARADVWALGLIGHELITGSLPKLDDDGRRVLDPSALAAFPAIAPVLRNCLALAPADRYQDACALRDALTTVRPRRRTVLVIAAIVVLAGIAGGAVMLANDRANDSARAAAQNDGPAPTDASPMLPVTPVKLVASAFSVAISPDAKEYAYTTADGRLFVAPLGGDNAREWKVPAIEQRTGSDLPRKSTLITTWACGWFSDHSIAVIAIADTGIWHLVRVHEDGRYTVLFSTTARFTATAAGDIAAIGVHETGVFIVKGDKPEDLEQIERIGSGEVVMALAVSPDASRVAVARLPSGNEDAEIQVITLRGGDSKTIWKAAVTNDIDQIIAWLDEHRIAFVVRGADTARLYAYDLRTGTAVERYKWAPGAYAGIGSAARGEVLFVGGRIAPGVGVGGPRGERLEPVHDPAMLGEKPAGWTPDGKLVFRLRDEAGVDRIMRLAPGGKAEPWPGLTGGETPNTLVGDSLLVHRADSTTAETVIERISANGDRTELRRIPLVDTRYLVRCAGDRDKPCFIEESNVREVTWRLFDPITGEVGRVLHKRLRRQRNMQTAALSLDGKTLAIVEGTSDLVLVDLTINSVRTIDAGTGVELQTVGFASDGSLWATSMGFRGHFFGLLKFAARGGRIADEPADVLHGPNRFFWRPTPSPDGKHLALGLIDFHLEVWRLAGV